MNIISNGNGVLSFEVDYQWFMIQTEGYQANQTRVVSHTVGWYFDEQGRFVWTSDLRKKT